MILPLALAGGGSLTTGAGAERAPDLFGQCFERTDQILVEPGKHMALGISRGQQARLVGIGEERDRHLRPDQDDVLKAGQHLGRLIDDIRNPLDKDPPAPALSARVRALGNQPRPSFGGDAAGKVEPFLA